MEDFILLLIYSLYYSKRPSQQQKTVEIEHKMEIATPTHDHKSLFLLALITISCIGAHQCGQQCEERAAAVPKCQPPPAPSTQKFQKKFVASLQTRLCRRLSRNFQSLPI
jgi:hypothetical protein